MRRSTLSLLISHLICLPLFLTSFSVANEAEKHVSPTSHPSRRPRVFNTEQNASVWDFWGLKQKVIDSYQDTISWEVELVFGKKAVDKLGKALLSFLVSPEGKRFIYQNKQTFLVNKLEETGDFEEAFWNSFESWLKDKNYKEALDTQIVGAINLLPLQPKLDIKAYYPQTPVRQTISRGVDHIQYLLAEDIARTMPGGGIAPGIIANGIRRASRGGAILPAVQKSYNQSRNALTERIVNLIGVVAKKLVQQGIEQRNIDIKASLTVTPWEKTEGFRKNPTFPIRSYYYAANAKKAIVPYQVTQFLDSIDEYDFQEEVKMFGNPH
jgi:hypothetical protein